MTRVGEGVVGVRLEADAEDVEEAAALEDDFAVKRFEGGIWSRGRVPAAERWYDLLLDRGMGRSLPDVEPSAPEFALHWLPDRLRAPVKQLLVAGRRLPQELVGWDQLRDRTR